jgi:hypothetical protein
MVAMVALSVTASKFLESARAFTAVTLEASQALRTLDSARAVASIKKVDEAIAEYNVHADIAAGKIEAGFWQKLVAWSAVAAEAVTGSIATQAKRIDELLRSAVEIGKVTLVPEAAVEGAKNAADMMARQAQLEITNARGVAELSAAYDKNALAIKNRAAATREGIDLDTENKTRVANDLRDARAQKILDDAAKARDAALTSAELGAGEYGGASEASRRQAEIDADRAFEEAKKKADEVVRLSDEDLTQKLLINREKRKKATDDETQSLVENASRQTKALAQASAESEVFVQKDVDRAQKRIENAAAVAESVSQSEEKIAQIRRRHLDIVESASGLEARLSESRERAVGPILSAIESVNEKYRSQRRALEALIDANIDAEQNSKKLADAELTRADEVLRLRRQIAQETAAQDAKAEDERAARDQREIERENKQLSHRVAMGRASMQEEMSYQRAAAADSGRRTDQQQEAERTLFALKKQYADEYFRYYGLLGASTWDEQLRSAEYFLSQTVEGSKQWFDAVQRVADVYKGINDQAKSIFQQEVSIAEQQARKSGRTMMSIRDVDKFLYKQRKQDERALSGKRVPIGDISGAVSRRELWRTIDREGLTPGVAFQRMMQDPQERLAETLAQTATQVGWLRDASQISTQSIADLGGAAAGAAEALRDAAEAAGMAADAMRDVPSGGAEAGGKLSSSGRYTNVGLSSADDSALGRNLQLGARRGPNAIETVQ